MNCADMILDPVGVANLDEINLSFMVESGVISPDFTWLEVTDGNNICVKSSGQGKLPCRRGRN